MRCDELAEWRRAIAFSACSLPGCSLGGDVKRQDINSRMGNPRASVMAVQALVLWNTLAYESRYPKASDQTGIACVVASVVCQWDAVEGQPPRRWFSEALCYLCSLYSSAANMPVCFQSWRTWASTYRVQLRTGEKGVVGPIHCCDAPRHRQPRGKVQ